MYHVFHISNYMYIHHAYHADTSCAIAKSGMSTRLGLIYQPSVQLQSTGEYAHIVHMYMYIYIVYHHPIM